MTTAKNVIGDLRPYPAYSDSGSPWLGKVPAGWEVRRNGRLWSERKETGFPDLPIMEVSLRTGVRVRTFGSSQRKQVMGSSDKYKRAVKGDLAYNMMRMWQGAVGIAPVDGLISPAYVVARPFPGTTPEYFAYLYRTATYMSEVENYSHGIVADRNRLYWDEFKQIPTPFPPPLEQAAIVRFLDHADGCIRRYIAAKQKLINLLEEQKQAIIHRAVTRGLNPEVRLRLSGVASLGDVPEHWEVARFKQRVAFQEGPGIMASDFRESGVPLLRISCVQGDIATLAGCNYLDSEMVGRRWARFAVQPGDYLLSASASTGTVVLATETVARAIPYTGILRLWPASQKTFMPFVRLFMACRPFQDQVQAAKAGVAIEHFGPSHLKRMFICLPPHEEQREIVGSVTAETRPFARAKAQAQRQIALLREYRARLIADVVTGTLDVRAAASGLPHEARQAQPDLDGDEDAKADDLENDIDADPMPDP